MLAQVLITLTVLAPGECKPIFGPGCKQACPVIAQASVRSGTFVLSKAAIQPVLVAKGIPAFDDRTATAIIRQRAKDEGWGKSSRYMELLQIPILGLAAYFGDLTGLVGALGGTTWFSQVSRSAAARAPNIEVNLDAYGEPQISLAAGQQAAIGLWTSGEYAAKLPQDQRVKYEWLVESIPESIRIADDFPRPETSESVPRETSGFHESGSERRRAPETAPEPLTPCQQPTNGSQPGFRPRNERLWPYLGYEVELWLAVGTRISGHRLRVQADRLVDAETLDFLMERHAFAEVDRLLATAEVRW